MDISLRTVLTAGVTAVTATAIVAAPSLVVQPKPEAVWLPVHAAAAVSPLTSDALGDIRAFAARTALLQGAAPAGAVVGDVGVQSAASDWAHDVWYGVQSWIDWGVDYAQEIAWWLAGWGVPFAGSIGDQIGLFYYQLIRPIANNYFDRWLEPVINDPLNPVVWWDGFVATVGGTINAAVNFGIAELNYFFGWILPPLPSLPPSWPFNTLASTASVSALDVAPSPLAAGPTGNMFVAGSEALLNAINSLGQRGGEAFGAVLDQLSKITGMPVPHPTLTAIVPTSDVTLQNEVVDDQTSVLPTGTDTLETKFVLKRGAQIGSPADIPGSVKKFLGTTQAAGQPPAQLSKDEGKPGAVLGSTVDLHSSGPSAGADDAGAAEKLQKKDYLQKTLKDRKADRTAAKAKKAAAGETAKNEPSGPKKDPSGPKDGPNTGERGDGQNHDPSGAA